MKPAPLPERAAGAASPYKSRGGFARLRSALRHSLAGLRAALRHEAALRQELLVGVPLLALTPFIAPGRWQGLAMAASIVLVWIVELLNSALETVADAVSLQPHPLIGRAKDIGSAAVLLSLLLAALVWGVALWSWR